MIEKALTLFAWTVVVFMLGWWSAWHPTEFFSWGTRFGTFLQNKVDQTPICPQKLVCTTPTPSITPYAN